MKKIVVVLMLLALAVVLEVKKNKTSADNVVSDVPTEPQTEEQNNIEQPETPPEPKQDEQLTANNIDDAVVLAKENNKKVLVLFTAEWCGPCRTLKKNLADEKLKDSLLNYVVVYLDYDLNRGDFKDFKIRALPSYFILNTDKQVLKNGSGVMSVDKLKLWLDVK